MCSVCARAGEEKKTQNFAFWEKVDPPRIPRISRVQLFFTGFLVVSEGYCHRGVNISLAARAREKPDASMRSVCARAGEEKKTQKLRFWELWKLECAVGMYVNI